MSKKVPGTNWTEVSQAPKEQKSRNWVKKQPLSQTAATEDERRTRNQTPQSLKLDMKEDSRISNDLQKVQPLKLLFSKRNRSVAPATLPADAQSYFERTWSPREDDRGLSQVQKTESTAKKAKETSQSPEKSESKRASAERLKPRASLFDVLTKRKKASPPEPVVEMTDELDAAVSILEPYQNTSKVESKAKLGPLAESSGEQEQSLNNGPRPQEESRKGPILEMQEEQVNSTGRHSLRPQEATMDEEYPLENRFQSQTVNGNTLPHTRVRSRSPSPTSGGSKPRTPEGREPSSVERAHSKEDQRGSGAHYWHPGASNKSARAKSKQEQRGKDLRNVTADNSVSTNKRPLEDQQRAADTLTRNSKLTGKSNDTNYMSVVRSNLSIKSIRNKRTSIVLRTRERAMETSKARVEPEPKQSASCLSQVESGHQPPAP